MAEEQRQLDRRGIGSLKSTAGERWARLKDLSGIILTSRLGQPIPLWRKVPSSYYCFHFFWTLLNLFYHLFFTPFHCCCHRNYSISGFAQLEMLEPRIIHLLLFSPDGHCDIDSVLTMVALRALPNICYLHSPHSPHEQHQTQMWNIPYRGI